MNMLVVLSEAGGGGAGGSQLQEIARNFGVDWPHLGAQIISFVIVCFMLHRFAYRPVLKMLELRRTRIAESLANAEKIKAELASAEVQRHEILKKANDQASQLIEAARATAARVLENETKKALAMAEELRIKSQAADARAHDQMLADLRREVGRLVVKTTAAVTGKVLTAEDQRRLAEESEKQVAA